MEDKEEEKGGTTEGNEKARTAQEAEMKKLGLTPHSERVKKEAGKESDSDEDENDEDEDSEDQEDEEEEDESEDEEDDSDDEEEEDEEDSEDEDNEDEEDEDEEEESQSHKKKGISFKMFNAVRSDLRKANEKIATLIKDGSKKTEDAPEDFTKRVDDLAKEIGVENPDGLKKIMALVKEIAKGESSNAEKKLADLEEKYGKIIKSTPIEDGFEKEWKSFEKSFAKEYPNATDEEIESAQKLMNELSHTPGVGGKVYKDADGRKLIDPYELDYIYFKNRDKFKEVVTGKKSRGMESGRTQGISKTNRDDKENKPLPKGATAKEIQDYEKRSNRMLENMDSLSAPVDNTI